MVGGEGMGCLFACFRVKDEQSSPRSTVEAVPSMIGVSTNLPLIALFGPALLGLAILSLPTGFALWDNNSLILVVSFPDPTYFLIFHGLCQDRVVRRNQLAALLLSEGSAYSDGRCLFPCVFIPFNYLHLLYFNHKFIFSFSEWKDSECGGEVVQRGVGSEPRDAVLDKLYFFIFSSF